jgi:hypothetical protein
MLQERNGLLREYYCGNGLSPLPHTPHLEIQSLYYSEFLFYSNSQEKRKDRMKLSLPPKLMILGVPSPIEF